MKYYRDIETGEVFGYDETDETQLPYMQEKIDAGYEDVSDVWPPEPEPIEPPAAPTKEELLAQLQELTAKIEAL